MKNYHKTTATGADDDAGTIEPWMHVLCTIGGAWAAQKWVNAKHELLADVNELRAYRGLPPMVGSKTYLPFVPPVEEAAKKE